MADLDDLFGSDSDDDDFPPQPDTAPAAETKDAAEDEVPEEPAAEVEAEDEEEAVRNVEPDEEAGPGPSDSGEGYRDLPPERPKGPPMNLDAAPVPRLNASNIALVTLSNIINIDTKPFDPATYKVAEEGERFDDNGMRRVRMANQNVIRWRRTIKDDGTEGIESNARFVRWSDGSLQLLVGDEALDVPETDIKKDNNYLFLRHVHAQFLEGMGHIGRKLAFRPGSLNSKYHQSLKKSVHRTHTKVNRVRSVATVEDPAAEKAARERAEEARIRATEQLERRQNKEMRRYTAAPRYESRPRGEAGITAQYLEAMDDDDGLGGDSDDAADGLTASERARNSLRRNIDDDQEAERRLSQAKRPQPSVPAPPAKRQHFGAIESDDEDEDVADEDAPPRKAQKGRQRGLVLSDDDD